jgi:hypothetical protein
MTSLDPTARKIIDFIRSVGISVTAAPIERETFLPGIDIVAGQLLLDPEKILYPGDLLHEAGHIAVTAPEERAAMNGNVGASSKMREAEEMMAIAWSYAACLYLNIDPHYVFHEYGYKGDGADIVKNFGEGRYFGVPVLQWVGMTQESGEYAYPNMIKWVRD